MKKLFFFGALLPMLCLGACGGGAKSAAVADADTLVEKDTTPLPDTMYASVGKLQWRVEVLDSTVDGTLHVLDDPYLESNSKLAFRANHLRNADFGGKVKGVPTRIVKDWVFDTDVDYTPTKLGVWGGGTGWTSQPLYVEWPDEVAKKFRNTPATKLTPDFSQKEIVVASLCGKLHFINFESGKASREPIDMGNPVKGTPMVDPRFNGLVYAGHGVQAHGAVCQNVVDLFSHSIVYQNPGLDPKASRFWPASDSSPIYADGFVFWPCENGLIYKYEVKNGKVKKHSFLSYNRPGVHAAGVESSMCVYKNYGYFGDNHGNILCINLNNMKPVWYYDNHDDIDATIVCEVENGVPFVYTACEVDRQGDTGMCHIAKLNGLNGEVAWAVQVPCTRHNINNKHFDGGMYSTPLLGGGNCSDLIFSTLANDGVNGDGHFYAFEKRTGKVVYKTKLKHYAWSSPVGFYNEKNELFIVVGDTYGYLYLIEGKTGRVIYDERFGVNFESSPVVVGNTLVVGSRGQSVYKVHIE